VSALAGLWGAQEVGRARLRDDLPAMEPVAAEAVGKADLVVVTGGASVGERDFAKAMFAPLDLELIFSKVAIKPGKPVWLGRAGQALVMGLPAIRPPPSSPRACCWRHSLRDWRDWIRPWHIAGTGCCSPRRWTQAGIAKHS
jgi:molybdopterin biosynthesis enzyme